MVRSESATLSAETYSCPGCFLQSVEEYQGGDIGLVHVPVGWLELRRPVVGSFPVISPAGQRVASLDVRIELHYYDDSVSSFQLQEYLASREAVATQQGDQAHHPPQAQALTAHDTTSEPGMQQQEQQVMVDFEEVLEQLDLFEVLHDKLYRCVCVGVQCHM